MLFRRKRLRLWLGSLSLTDEWNHWKGRNLSCERLCYQRDPARPGREVVRPVLENERMEPVGQIQARPSSPTAAIHLLSGDHATDQTGLSVASNKICCLPLGYATQFTRPSSPHETSQSPFDDQATRLAPPTPGRCIWAVKTGLPVDAVWTMILPS